MTEPAKWIPATEAYPMAQIHIDRPGMYTCTYIPIDERYARADMAFGKQGFWPKRRERTGKLLDRCGSGGEP